MRSLPLSLAVLACPIGMVRRRPSGGAGSPAYAGAQRELARSRSEIQWLRTGRARRVSRRG